MLQAIEDYERRSDVRFGILFLRILGTKFMEKCPRYTDDDNVINVWVTIGESEGIKDKYKIARIPQFLKKK